MDMFEKLRKHMEKLGQSQPILSGPPEWLIVGLGNPGTQDEFTRHNAGFLTIDQLAKKCHVTIDRIKFKGLCADAMICGKRVLLLKPQTYMNHSGQAVQEAAEFYKIPPDRICVIFDDISLPVGRLRVRRKGSDGGHNGIKSILYLLGSDQFPRVKIGVGAKPRPDYDLADWVLSRFTREEGILLEETTEKGVQALQLIVQGNIDEAMNRFNQNQYPSPIQNAQP